MYKGNLTKAEAFDLMMQGKKVCREGFSSEEYIWIDDKGNIRSEEGYYFADWWEQIEPTMHKPMIKHFTYLKINANGERIPIKRDIMKDRGLFLFVVLIKWGWMFFMACMDIFYHVFKEPNESMFTRGVIALVGFSILVKLEQIDWKNNEVSK